MSVDAGLILIVEDEPPIRRLLRTTLRANNYDVAEAESVAEALRHVRERMPDVVILDLGLPDGDGLDLIRELRKFSPVPIVVLSSRDQENVKVVALDSGADDFVSKPFGVEELMARLRTALRHRYMEQGAAPIFQSGPLTMDLVRRHVHLRGVEVRLSPKEYDLLREMVIHAGKVLTHRHLLNAVWGGDNGADVQYLRVYVRQLRSKIEDHPEQPALILTEPGVGYRLHQP